MGERVSALEVIKNELPKWWMDPQQEDLRNTLGLAIPQSPAELGSMLALGPAGKAIKLGGLALAGSTYSPDAEAGILRFADPKKIAELIAKVKQRMGNPLHTPTAYQVAREADYIPLTGGRVNPEARAVDTTFLDVKNSPYVEPILFDKFRGNEIDYSSVKLEKALHGKTLKEANAALSRQMAHTGVDPHGVGRSMPGNHVSHNSYSQAIKDDPLLGDINLKVESLGKEKLGEFRDWEGPRGTAVINKDNMHPGKFDIYSILQTLNHEALGHGWIHNYAKLAAPVYHHKKDVSKLIDDFTAHTKFKKDDLIELLDNAIERLGRTENYNGQNIFTVMPQYRSGLNQLRDSLKDPNSIWGKNIEEQLARSVEAPSLRDTMNSSIGYADAPNTLNNFKNDKYWTQGYMDGTIGDIMHYMNLRGRPKNQQEFDEMILKLAPTIHPYSIEKAIKSAENLPGDLDHYSKQEILSILKDPYYTEESSTFPMMLRNMGIKMDRGPLLDNPFVVP